MADEAVPLGVPAPPPPPREPARRPYTIWRGVLHFLLGVLTGIFLIWLVLYVTKGRFLKHPFERIVSGQTHRAVKVAGDFQLYFDPITIKFVAEGLTIANPQWATKPHFFEAKRIDTRIATLPLIVGKRRIHWLDLLNGQVDLEWDAAHQHNTWTFENPDSKKKGKPFQFPTIRRAMVAGTTLRYVDPKMQLMADIAFQTIRATDTRLPDTIKFDGSGRIRTTPFTVNGTLLSPNATAGGLISGGGENKLKLHAVAARNVLDVSGTLPGVTEIERVPLSTEARGANLAELFSIIGIAIPETRAYRLTGTFTKDGDRYSFTGMRGRFGDSDLAGKIAARGGGRVKLDATLSTHSLDIVDAAPFIGYNPDAAAKGKQAVIQHVGGHPQVLPDAPLRVDALKNFDADLHYTVDVIRGRNVPVSNVDLTLSLDHGVLRLAPLNFTMARGRVGSNIVIDANRVPVHTSYDVHLSPTPMGTLLAGYGVDQSGTSGVLSARVSMEGDGNSVHESLAHSNGRIAVVMPAGTFWTRNVQASELDAGVFVQKMFEHKLKQPVQINCGLIGFTVRNGVAAADPILIDTAGNVIVGRGGFSFKTEAIDLAIRADSKKFSLFSGQSPVGLGGYFAGPKLNVISSQLVGRAGAALGLGIFASPIAALIPFIDPGDAKAAACGPVLAGARASAQRTTKGQPRDDVGHGTTAKAEDGKKTPDERHKQHKKFLGIF